ncbi:MAG: FadR/GntR family transcriptional regulator [Desulfovermiculus sp.]
MKKNDVSLKRTKRQRLYKDIISQIQKLIQEGTLKPGDQLLPERKLSEKLGVSRTAIREALTALDSMGFIEITPGGGSYVKEIDIENVIEPLAIIMLKEKEDVLQLLEAREILETEIIKLAAKRATSNDISRVYRAAREMENDAKNNRDADNSDVNFHLEIAMSSHNDVLYNIMNMMAKLMKEVYGPSRKKLLADKQQVQMFCDQHSDMCKAIADGDEDKAAQLIQEHLHIARQELSKM